jgi:uncharacterized protein
MGFRLTKYFLLLRKNRKSLLVNTLNGSVDLLYLNKTQRSSLIPGQKFTSSLFDQSTVDHLHDHQYLLTQKQEQQLRQQTIAFLQKKSAKPQYWVTINPTEACNLVCSYCINQKNRNCFIKHKRSTSLVMSSLQLNKILKIVNRLHLHHQLADNQIKLFGGEPFLPSSFELVRTIFDYCFKKKITIGITTNGTYLSHYLPLFDLYPNTINCIQVTLDGPKKINNQRRITATGVGYFDQIVDGINALLQRKIHVTLRSNFDSQTVKYLSPMIKIINQHGWNKSKHFYYSPHNVNENFDGGRSFSRYQFINTISPIIIKQAPTNPINVFCETDDLLLKAFLPTKKQTSCFFPSIHGCATMGGYNLTFASDSKIYACEAAVGVPKFCLGTYFPKYKLHKNNIYFQNKTSQNSPQCRQCIYQFICGGGCSIANYNASGKLNGIDKINGCDQILPCLQSTLDILTHTQQTK